jgi:uncharacterized protein (UPF0335 family)
MTKPKPKPKPSSKKPSSSKPKPTPRRPAARMGDNTLEGRAQPFMKRIESLIGDLDSERGAYMAKCRPIHEDIREVYAEAKDHGVPVKALKGLVKWRELEKKQAGIATDFADIDEKASYDQLVEALGPLGFAAAVAAGHRRADNGGDPRPAPKSEAAAPPAEQPRADESELARVGRGHEPEQAAPPTPGETPPTAH